VSKRAEVPNVGRVRELRVPALAIKQGRGRDLFCFAVDGKVLPTFATVSRIHRDESFSISGYQRPEIAKHIASIRKYIESPDAMIPNALVIAFDKRVKFVPTDGRVARTGMRVGHLIIPLVDLRNGNTRPGWVVDGQQRYAALRDADIRTFPIYATAFISDSDAEQRSQFILVNSTKPLPKGLIHELLPSTTGLLPVSLQLRKFSATLVERLNYDSHSPLQHMIHTPTTPDGVIKDNSLLRMIENSLSDGALYKLRTPRLSKKNTHAALKILKDYWSAVERTFPDAWGVSPRRSRLMHGVGIVSLGFLMDATADRFSSNGETTVIGFEAELAKVKDVCHWTEGFWDFGNETKRKWNDLQNTPRDIQLLTDFLLRSYRFGTPRKGSKRHH
jgi:DGQHR domain-containing protein